MTYSVIASNIPESVTKDRVEEFFAFCGKIESVEQLYTDADPNSFRIKFVSESAVSTALLLNQAELGGAAVIVSSELTPEVLSQIQDKAPHSPSYPPNVPSTPNADPYEAGPTADIAQELKPKSAIFAQYLSRGYVLGDHLVQKAVDYDKQNGCSDKFKRFLTDLDTKFSLQEKQKGLQTKQQQLDQKYKISSNLLHYYDRALKTDAGSRLHGFYTNVVKDATQIHEEARRLAQLEKEKKVHPSN